MNNAVALSPEFERQKNLQAALYTAGITGALLLLVFLIKFYEPVAIMPVQEEYIDINLGSSNVGSGNDQPQLPGEPAPAQQVAYTPAQPVVKASAEPVKDIEENNDREATPVYKPAVTKPQATKINEETKVVKTTTTAATTTPAPPAPQPRAVMGQVRGGNGNGGNGAETYKPGTGEGLGGGAGDQGSIGGNPNGRDYTPRRLAARTVSMPARNFEDDFKESGKIVLEVDVDENGHLQSANFQPRGSSISNRGQIEIAKRRARELPYPKYPGGFKQNVEFHFEVKN
jgi:outer membrane biosynthesis protein TonB